MLNGWQAKAYEMSVLLYPNKTHYKYWKILGYDPSLHVSSSKTTFDTKTFNLSYPGNKYNIKEWIGLSTHVVCIKKCLCGSLYVGAKLNAIWNFELLNLSLPLEVEIWINAIARHYRDKNPRLAATFKFTRIDGVLPKCC